MSHVQARDPSTTGAPGKPGPEPHEPDLVTIIVPTYREYAFGRSLDALLDYLRTLPSRTFEILVVDDGDAASQAGMDAEIAQRRATAGPRVSVELVRGPRKGKGAAVRLGAQRATGAVVFVVDADLPVPLEYVGEFLEKMEGDRADVVLGERSRDRYAGDAVRHFLSRALWLIQRTLVFHGPAFEDTQCGFKAFRRASLQRIAERQVVDGGMYDLEYLYAATRLKLRVERVAVASAAEVRPTRIHLWRCMLVDPVAIARFKLRGVLGHYS